MRGIDVFQDYLRQVRGVSVWVAGGSVAVPFLASFLSLVPPEPTGLPAITGAFQVLVLMLAFQFYKGAAKKIVNRRLLQYSIASALIFFAYLVFFMLVTVEGRAEEIFVIGFQCTEKALTVYSESCPFLSPDILREAAYKELELWLRWSILVNKAALILGWFSFFCLFSAAIGTFTAYQMRKVTH